MFGSLGSLAYRGRWTVLVLVLAFTVGGGIWGLGVFDRMKQGGYDDPNSESARAATIAEQTVGRPDDVVVVYGGPGVNVDDPALAGKVSAQLKALPADVVRSHTSYWDTRSPAMADPAHEHALAVISLVGTSDTERMAGFEKIVDQLSVDGVHSQIGGKLAMEHSMRERSKSDIAIAEAVSLPVVLVLLILIFGSVVAAALPVLVGGLAILGSLAVLHVISYAVDVSTFAINIATLLGLGLAIDYGLFSVGRFREERAAGHDTATAVRTTVATAGRTVAFSATLLVIALAGLLVFPADFLKSLAYGGMSAVAIAAIISLTLLPALLGILGHRVDALAVPRRRRERSGTRVGLLPRMTEAVLRRPVSFAVAIVAGLAVLAIPLGSLTFGAVTEKLLPVGDPTRTAIETVSERFPAAGNGAATIVLRGTDGRAPGKAEVDQFVAGAATVSGVAVAPSGSAGDVVLLRAQLPGDSQGAAAKDALFDLRAIPSPAGTEVLVGGFTAQVHDSNQSIVDRLPLMAALLVGSTFVLMLLAFGSVLLPLKAVVMSALSLGATYGVLVWTFQLGHGADLLGVTPTPVQAGMFVLIGAVVFGLSTDYETFLLSRMVEARAAGMSTVDAVRTGLSRTGRMITAAALLLIVVTGAFASSEISMMRLVGVGMIVALVLDATVVRMLLVPAVVRLLGAAAWWAPGPLRRLRDSAGKDVSAAEDLVRDQELERVR